MLNLPNGAVNFSQNLHLIALLPSQVLVWAQCGPDGSYVIPSLELACAQQAWSTGGAHSCQPTPFHEDIL